MRTLIQLSLVIVLMFPSSKTLCQHTFSATQNWLTGVSFGDCMQRSRETMVNNGFTATPQVDKVSFIGANEKYHAFLICQQCQDKVITTIVLSTGNSSAEATVLRDRMLHYIATGKDQSITPGSVYLVTNKQIFNPGEKITIDFSGMAGNMQDWIGIVEKGKPDNHAGTWKYTEGKKSGSLTFEALPPGEYEARAFFNNSYQVEKRYPFSVRGSDPGGNMPVTSKQLKIHKGVFIVGEKIDVQYFNLPGNATDWIAISEAGKPETSSIQWFHTQGKREGTFSFNALPAGNFEARLFYNNSYKLEDRLQFKVITNPEGDYIIKTEKMDFRENEPIKVMFSNSQGTSTDWVAITPAGKPDGEYGQWFHKGALASGELTFTGVTPGDYEIRYYLNNGYEIKKRIRIRVVR